MQSITAVKLCMPSFCRNCSEAGVSSCQEEGQKDYSFFTNQLSNYFYVYSCAFQVAAFLKLFTQSFFHRKFTSYFRRSYDCKTDDKRDVETFFRILMELHHDVIEKVVRN